MRTDSVARVSGRGVLGDKAIDISLGTSEGDPIPPNGAIPSGSSGDLTTLLKTGGELMDNLVAISENVRKLTDAFAEPEVAQEPHRGDRQRCGASSRASRRGTARSTR